MFAVVPVFLGLMAILAVLGTSAVNQVIGGLLGGIPLIGGYLKRAIQLDASVVDWLWNEAAGGVNAILHPHVQHATEQGLNVQAHQAAHDAINKIHKDTIPTANAGTLDTATQRINDLARNVGLEQSQQVAWDAHATGQINQLYHQANVFLPGEITRLGGTVASNLTTVQNQIATGHAQTERDIAAAGAQAAASGHAGAVTELQPKIDAVNTRLGGLGGQITTVVNPAITALQTAVGLLTTTVTGVEECTQAICESGSGNDLGNLGKGLQDLTAFFEEAALFAFLAAAAADPKGVATALDDTLAGPVNAATSAFRDLVHV